jgi:hypothetical protein
VSTPALDDSGFRDLIDRAGQLGAVKTVAPKRNRDTLAPDIRGYFMERRRALMTELDSLNKLLGLTTK